MSLIEENTEYSARRQAKQRFDSDSVTASATIAESTLRTQQAEQLSIAGRLLRRLLRSLGNPAVAVSLWNGEEITTSVKPPVARITFTDRTTLWKVFRNAEYEFGEAYSNGKVYIDGDLAKFLEEIYRGEQSIRRNMFSLAPSHNAIAKSPRRARSMSNARDNIHHHYDIGNEFYALWLGKTMAYTCAYFPTPTATLDAAQIAKMHHICRKLRLQPGETVVEAGCGWGTFGLFMARHYGVKVTAFNISREQISYARARAAADGMTNQVEYVEDDYRNIAPGKDGRYDAFVSVGMLEHVGPANYPELGSVIDGCLKPSGRGLIHSIGRNRSMPLNRWIEKRIFPGARPPSLKEMMDIFETANFAVLDVENIRLHYAKTLYAWRMAFEQSSDRIAAMFDEKFVRMWRFYLAGSEAAFTGGEMQLFQALFAPQANNNLAWTREDIYRKTLSGA